MSETSHTNSAPLRQHLSGMAADLLMANALLDSEPACPWPDGYERIGLLGSGGMGEVYLARDPRLGREVAIKLVLPNLRSEPMMVERLFREARAMSAINHSGIVTIHRLVPLDEESAAIIMEYVDGGNLHDLIHKYGTRFPLVEALRIAKETAAALQAAHQHEIVHRDLKPENILIAADGRIKITDFGLAAPLDSQLTRLTLAGTATGTADYMAPERHAGGDSGVRGDVYSLGVVLYEMLTGSLPRGHFDPPRLGRKEIPKAISDAVMRALKSDPERRYASMAAFVEDLDKPSSNKTLLVTISAGLLAVIMISFLVFQKPGNRTDDPIAAPGPASSDLPAAIAPLSPGAWVKVLPTLDPSRHSISGTWRTSPEGLVSDNQICIIQLGEKFPESYEVRTTFTRLEGEHSIALFFQTPNGMGSIDIDGWGLGLSGVQSIDGNDLRSGNAFSFPLENGRRYELLVRTLPESVSISIDGIHRITTSIGGRRLGIVEPWAWKPGAGSGILALGSYQSSTRFSDIEWRPLMRNSSGK